jgi:hypothetical protein
MRRTRRVRTFSFQETDERALEAGRARLSRILPGATESETVRLALQLLKDASSAVLEQAAGRLIRLKTGRPPSLARLTTDLKRCVEEDEKRMERLQLLEEIHRLEQQGDQGTSEWLTLLYARLGMIPPSDRIEKGGGS